VVAGTAVGAFAAAVIGAAVFLYPAGCAKIAGGALALCGRAISMGKTKMHVPVWLKTGIASGGTTAGWFIAKGVGKKAAKVASFDSVITSFYFGQKVIIFWKDDDYCIGLSMKAFGIPVLLKYWEIDSPALK